MSLSFENLKLLFSSNQASEKAKIIAELCQEKFLRNGDDLYKMNIVNEN